MEIAKQYFEKNMDRLTKIDTIPNRNLKDVSIDFVTNKGIFTIQENINTIEKAESTLFSIFEESKKLKLEIENAMNRFQEKKN